MRSFCYITTIFLCIYECAEKSAKAVHSEIDLSDTVKRSEIKFIDQGDTLIENQIITFTGIDPTVPLDSFYYEFGSKYPKKETFRMHFNRKEVISYCDSMLQTLNVDPDYNFNEINTYKAILMHAKRGWTETIGINETHYLMNRFRPLIINPDSKQMPTYYFTIHRKSSDREDIERAFRTQDGDTIYLSWENIWLSNIKVDDSN